MFGWAVIFNQPLPFVDAFAEDLAASLKQLNTGRGLSFAQRTWLKYGNEICLPNLSWA